MVRLPAPRLFAKANRQTYGLGQTVWERSMLGAMLANRFALARVISWSVAAGLAYYLASYRGWSWWAWTLAGAAVLLVMPLLWGVFLGTLEQRKLRRGGWPV